MEEIYANCWFQLYQFGPDVVVYMEHWASFPTSVNAISNWFTLQLVRTGIELFMDVKSNPIQHHPCAIGNWIKIVGTNWESWKNYRIKNKNSSPGELTQKSGSSPSPRSSGVYLYGFNHIFLSICQCLCSVHAPSSLISNGIQDREKKINKNVKSNWKLLNLINCKKRKWNPANASSLNSKF